MLLGIVAFVIVYVAVHALGDKLEVLLHPGSLRAKAALKIAGSVVLEWASLAGILAVLHVQGRSVADIGWRKPAAFWGWLAAGLVTLLYVGGLSIGPLAGSPFLSDWSVFRIATALSMGVSAGVCEEAIFRGFVMTQAKNAGLPTPVQIMLSAILFGLAHAGWGGLSGQFNLMAFVGSVGATTVFGGLFAAIYVASRRSLTPVIAAHAAIDLVIEPWLVMYALGGGFTQ